MFAGKKSAQIREILISESAWEEMTCLFAPSLSEREAMLKLAEWLQRLSIAIEDNWSEP
ncbi:TPA: hypothetical protein N6556_002532 [Escherichia coli]|uniref:hypothetical protein n=1 Tax=Escherichia coli TaxID=562 RepID=UPI00156E2F3A|nr:hypothetical protein [Escherichia coli]HCO0368232.1 hypothetical protein [Escherichia coli]